MTLLVFIIWIYFIIYYSVVFFVMHVRHRVLQLAYMNGALLIKWDLMWVLMGIPHVMMESMFQHEVEDATYLF